MKIVAFADLHVDKNRTGRVKGGIPIRVLDVLANLDYLIDFAIAKDVDYVLFAGDMYDIANPSAKYRQMVYKRLARLAVHGIESVFIYGNHDTSKSEISSHALVEIESLGIPHLHLIDCGYLDFPDVRIHGISWQFREVDIDFPLATDRPNVCIAHCTVPNAAYSTGRYADGELVLGRDFSIPLDYFTRYHFTCLGHIHKPQVLSENPFVGYPGSCDQFTWGEIYDPPQGFFFVDDDWSVAHIPFSFRERVYWEIEASDQADVIDQLPPLDPETMYRVRVFMNKSFQLPQAPANTFSFTYEMVPRYTNARARSDHIDPDANHTQILKDYLGLKQYKEVEAEWEAIYYELNN